MPKLFIIQILRLWIILSLVIIMVSLSGNLLPRRAFLYLEHTKHDLHNTIWILDTLQGVQFPLIERPDLFAFDLAPDGQTLVYQTGFGEESAIFFLGIYHARHERIAAGHVECPKWSPDSRTIVYENYGDYSLYLMDIASREPTLFKFLGSGIARCSYDWTPSGENLIHTDWPRPHVPSARVVRTEIHTGESTVLFSTGRPVRQLTVASDGITVTFDSQTYAVIMNSENRDIQNVEHFAYTFSAVWSPAQEYIAFGYQKPLLNIRDDILRGIAVVDANNNIVFHADVGTISHVAWWANSP